MDIFSIMKNNPLILNIDIFEKATKRYFLIINMAKKIN